MGARWCSHGIHVCGHTGVHLVSTSVSVCHHAGARMGIHVLATGAIRIAGVHMGSM
jgi:hypothetical protein